MKKQMRYHKIIGAGLLILGLLAVSAGVGSTMDTSADPGSQSKDYQVVETNGTASGEQEASLGTAVGEQEASPGTAADLQVHYINVGQGDCTLIICQGHSMLIDGGNNDQGTWVQSYLQKQNVITLDYIIATHPDSDHIGGLDVVLNKFPCTTFIMPDITNNTETYRDLQDALLDAGTAVTQPIVGTVYQLGDASFQIVGPVREDLESTNNNSVCLLLTHGNNRFLFTGDGEKEEEKDIMATQINLAADVYKVPHHGSADSSSHELLDMVNPEYAVISCGEDNSYGFPKADILNRLRGMGTEVFRTDEQGTIVAVSDGTNISWNCSPSETWQSGETKENSDSSKACDETGYNTEKETTNAVKKGVLKDEAQKEITYVVNTNTGKFHLPDCPSVSTIHPEHRLDSIETRDQLVAEGYEPCGNCKP